MQNQENPLKQLSTRIVYENPWMHVREDKVMRPDGTEGTYGIVEADDAVIAVAVNDRRAACLIRLFSYSSSTWSWVLPGGNSDGQDLETAAKRELKEEAGIVANEWISLRKVRTAGGVINHKHAYFLARDLTLGTRPRADDSDLIIDGKFVAFEDIDEMILDGEIDDSPTITGIYLARQWLANNGDK